MHHSRPFDNLAGKCCGSAKYLPGVHAAVVGSARFTYVSRFGGQLFLSLLLRLPGSCSATPEWGITPRGDGNHLGFFLATFDVAINVVRVSPLLLKGACSLPEPALVGAALAVARSLGEIGIMPARTLRFRPGGKAMTPYRQIRNFSGPCQMSGCFHAAGQFTGWLTEDG